MVKFAELKKCEGCETSFRLGVIVSDLKGLSAESAPVSWYCSSACARSAEDSRAEQVIEEELLSEEELRSC